MIEENKKTEVIYRNDFKVVIPTSFSASIIYDMFKQNDHTFIGFYERYQETKKQRAKDRWKHNYDYDTFEQIKDAFRNQPKYFGKIIDKIIVNK